MTQTKPRTFDELMAIDKKIERLEASDAKQKDHIAELEKEAQINKQFADRRQYANEQLLELNATLSTFVTELKATIQTL